MSDKTPDKTGAVALGHVNTMPAPTWHRLRMNGASVQVPAGLERAPHVAVRGAGDAGRPRAFDEALEAAQARWEESHPEPTAQELAQLEANRAAEADATYGGTALSSYQARADQLERARSLAAAFETGMGADAARFLSEYGEQVVVEAAPGEQVDAVVRVSGTAGAVSAAAVDLVAGERSHVNLTLVVADDGSEPDGLDAGGKRAVAATLARVFAGRDARVRVTRIQALGPGYTDLDDMGLFADERAVVEVDQKVLGAAEAYTGLAADLRGDDSSLDIRTRYLGMDDQMRDFNYIVRHHGRKTESDLEADGVLAGRSRKVLRGTIDLIRGARGAQGSEHETVLLLDEGVENKTVPVLLVNEDDVAGNHGATIGHIRDDQLFYLASRGLSRDAAERMFASALVEQAALESPDEDTRRAVIRLGERLSPGFGGLFDEEA